MKNKLSGLKKSVTVTTMAEKTPTLSCRQPLQFLGPSRSDRRLVQLKNCAEEEQK